MNSPTVISIRGLHHMMRRRKKDQYLKESLGVVRIIHKTYLALTNHMLNKCLLIFQLLAEQRVWRQKPERIIGGIVFPENWEALGSQVSQRGYLVGRRGVDSGMYAYSESACIKHCVKTLLYNILIFKQQ